MNVHQDFFSYMTRSMLMGGASGLPPVGADGCPSFEPLFVWRGSRPPILTNRALLHCPARRHRDTTEASSDYILTPKWVTGSMDTPVVLACDNPRNHLMARRGVISANVLMSNRMVFCWSGNAADFEHWVTSFVSDQGGYLHTRRDSKSNFSTNRVAICGQVMNRNFSECRRSARRLAVTAGSRVRPPSFAPRSRQSSSEGHGEQGTAGREARGRAERAPEPSGMRKHGLRAGLREA